MDELNRIKELSLPLIQYLMENHNPHVSITVSTDKVLVTEDIMSIPLENIDGQSKN